MTKEEFIRISKKYGFEIKDNTTNLTVDVYFNKFKYLNNELHFNLIRLERKRNHCVSWQYDIEDNTLVHINGGMVRIYIKTSSELENLYARFDSFIKKAEKDVRLKQIGEL